MGKSKPKKAKPAVAANLFSGITEYNADLDGFASASGAKVQDPVTKQWKLNITSKLDPELRTINDSAQRGLQGVMGFMERPLESRLADIQAGKNNHYNLNSLMNQQMLDQQLGLAQQRYSRSGLENSTLRGGVEGQLMNDATLRDLTTRQAALDNEMTDALQRGAAQSAAMDQIFNFSQLPFQTANNNMMEAMGQVNQTNMFNAQQLQRTNELNAQIQNQMVQQQNERRRQMISAGSLLFPPLGVIMGEPSSTFGALNTIASIAGAGSGGLSSVPRMTSTQASYMPQGTVWNTPIQQQLYANNSSPFVRAMVG